MPKHNSAEITTWVSFAYRKGKRRRAAAATSALRALSTMSGDIEISPPLAKMIEPQKWKKLIGRHLTSVFVVLSMKGCQAQVVAKRT